MCGEAGGVGGGGGEEERVVAASSYGRVDHLSRDKFETKLRNNSSQTKCPHRNNCHDYTVLSSGALVTHGFGCHSISKDTSFSLLASVR